MLVDGSTNLVAQVRYFHRCLKIQSEGIITDFRQAYHRGRDGHQALQEFAIDPAWSSPNVAPWSALAGVMLPFVLAGLHTSPTLSTRLGDVMIRLTYLANDRCNLILARVTRCCNNLKKRNGHVLSDDVQYIWETENLKTAHRLVALDISCYPRTPS